MSSESLVLADDTTIQSVHDLTPLLSASLGADPDDFVVGRPGWRTPSLLIDQATVALLEEFRQPRSVVAAVLAYAAGAKLDPRLVLRHAHPVLGRLVTAGVLVAAGSDAAHPLTSTLVPGDTVGTVTVHAAMQVLRDTEVYHAAEPDGTAVALKITRSGAAQGLLRNEAQILTHLDGGVTAALRATGRFDDRFFLTTLWRPGVDVGAAATALRATGDPESVTRLHQLCGAVLDAYARLHTHGVVHGDVHHRNVLVDLDEPDPAVTLIDFGLARRPIDSAAETLPRRGVGFTFEPEYAAARLAGTPPPPASELGEQYALAALLFRLLTGRHYLDFRLDAELLRQIRDDPPLPFAACGATPWPRGEAVLTRALAKEPTGRFPSVAAFAHAFAAATAHAPIAAPPLPGIDGRELLAAVVEQLGRGPHNAGTAAASLDSGASLHSGAAGVAYLFLRLAGLDDDPRLLATADIWAEHASRTTSQPNPAAGPIALLHTQTGVHLIRAMIGSARGDDHATTTAVDAFCTAAAQPCPETDATLGRASVLIGCSHLLPLLPSGPAAATVERLGTATQASLNLFDAPASDNRSLGIAHGQAGLLYASLLWADATGTPPGEQTERALNTLAALATPAGRGLHWPIKTGDSSRPPATGWCHGSAGWVHLWNLADTFLPGRSYGPLAESAAWHTWQTPSHTGGSLCCGYAGQAYALLAVHRRTGDPAWLTRAAALARRAADPRTRGLRPGSLYAGDVGVALLTAELQRPDLARMPAFEPEPRRSGW